MAQEIVTINSEADVGISREAVDSVKGKLTKSNLKRINRNECGVQLKYLFYCHDVLTLNSVGSAQSAN